MDYKSKEIFWECYDSVFFVCFSLFFSLPTGIGIGQQHTWSFVQYMAVPIPLPHCGTSRWLETTRYLRKHRYWITHTPLQTCQWISQSQGSDEGVCIHLKATSYCEGISSIWAGQPACFFFTRTNIAADLLCGSAKGPVKAFPFSVFSWFFTKITIIIDWNISLCCVIYSFDYHAQKFSSSKNYYRKMHNEF